MKWKKVESSTDISVADHLYGGKCMDGAAMKPGAERSVDGGRL